MCIIAYVRPNVKITEETIRRCFVKNPDGAGIMYKLTPNSSVQIIKGFYKVNELLDAWNQIPESAERAIHCRISTAGNPKCVHPFPVCDSYSKMIETKCTCDVGLAHNGIISFCNPSGGLKSDHSDTMEFTKRYVNRFKNRLSDPDIQDLLEAAASSRLLIFRKGEQTLLLGDWHKDDNGVYYSNTGYKEFDYSRCYGGYNYGYNWGGYNYGYKSDKKETPKETKKECASSLQAEEKKNESVKKDEETAKKSLLINSDYDTWGYKDDDVYYATLIPDKEYWEGLTKDYIIDCIIESFNLDFDCDVIEVEAVADSEENEFIIAYASVYGQMLYNGEFWDGFRVREDL